MRGSGGSGVSEKEQILSGSAEDGVQGGGRERRCG